MVTHVFKEVFPLLFNMNTLVIHHSLFLAYINSLCVGILEDFDIGIIQVEVALTVLSS